MTAFPVFGVRDLAERGYHVVYHEEQVNHCPGCGRTHWIIGRISAECAFCATALPLADVSTRNAHESAVHNGHRTLIGPAAWAA